MLIRELFEPESIVVVGGSNDTSKPGGSVLKNIIAGGYKGKLFAVNPKETEVQGIPSSKTVSELNHVDLAIIAIASKFIPETMEILASEKGCKAFIVLSAGFSEIGREGKKLEEQITEIVSQTNGCLIGPNCMGVINENYKGMFGGPIPTLDPKGCDFVSGSGATAVFILETAIPMGIRFASVYSVGNSSQIGVEDILRHWDESFVPEKSSKVKLIYLEKISKPEMFLKHCRSLIKKGCRIAAIKSGTTEAGSRAVSSHTGALAGSDLAVDALLKKAGVLRCYGREELAYAAGIFQYDELKGNRIAIITHAGGPGVMLTDILSRAGFEIPHLTGPAADELLTKLNFGSSVANPIDFIATGTAEQLGIILDYVDNKFDNIDGSVVIFGTPGLFDVSDVYILLDNKMKSCKKPVYPVLPSIVQAKDAINKFTSLGRTFFQDEVQLGKMLYKISNTSKPSVETTLPPVDKNKIEQICGNFISGFLPPEAVQGLLYAAGIPRVAEYIAYTKDEALVLAIKTGFPLVMKAIGPVHKSDIGGVKLNLQTTGEAAQAYEELLEIPGTEGVIIQKFIQSETELFAGAKFEKDFGHLILCGVGGVFIEILKDFAYGLSPLSLDEARGMIRSLKSYRIFQGVRGKAGIDELKFADILIKLSALLEAAPGIKELDLNPLLVSNDSILAVDARILV